MRSSAIAVAAAVLAPGILAAQSQPTSSASLAQFDPKEWAVPFGAETRPRDPYADAQGRVWFVGQNGNYVAYLDNKTGNFKRYEIDPGTNPHNLVVEKGMVWFTGNRNNRIVKLDPTSGKLTTYMIPDSTVRDPHTITFDPKSGIAWFTAQNSNTVGRFEPATGKFRLWKTGERSRPYGIVLDSKGRPWFDLFGTNKIGTVDPQTLELKTYALPNDTTRPRRIAITSDDRIYYGDYTRGYLGHLDPKTGKVEEFQSPGGPESKPYAIDVTADGAVWYVETGDETKNMLVRFNPETKKFQTWAIPGGGGTVRNMEIDKQGNLWLAESGVGRISRVTIKTTPATQ
jgi:virginiamycin B lyase